MCGRYKVPGEDTEIRPGDEAFVITLLGERRIRWGVKMQDSGRLLINSRSETAHQKPMFQHAMRQGRCIAAASSFFEWDNQKRCHAFASPQGDTLYMAALYMKTDDGTERFTILTREARNGCEKVHPRMPCLLPSEEYRYLWLHDDGLASQLLNADVPLEMKRIPDKIEQINFLTS